MKRYFALVLLGFTVMAVSVRAQSLDDQYFAIFNLIQEADQLSTNQPAKAIAKYLQAQTTLARFQKGNPDYNPQVIGFRLNYVATRLESLSAATGSNVASGQGQTPPLTDHSGKPAEATNAPGDLQWEVNALKQQVAQMMVDRGLLQEKLKEALAAQPAENDPRELAKAEERIRSLQKEVELLKAAAETPKAQPAAVDSQALQQAQAKLVEQQEALAKLQTEREALQKLVKSNPDLDALKVENELLKKQILNSSNTAAPIPPPAKEDSSRLKALEQERDRLAKDLESARKSAAAKKTKGSKEAARDLELQLTTARAKLAILEAQQVPYTPEELALLKQPTATLTEPQPKPGNQTAAPAGASKLIAEAQTAYRARQFDKAEAAYLEVLKLDPSNIVSLANLAAIQAEAGKLEMAEKNAKAALAASSEDAFSLYIMGLIKFRQKQYDESLDVLSRASKLDPQNAEIQNFVGLALSEKGMRIPAEAALRRAIQLQPGYANAHYNLAVAYANQKPPAVELGRYHYQKALSLGHPRNAEMDAKLGSR